jgi:5,10-methylenetetrahydrofolate reductase
VTKDDLSSLKGRVDAITIPALRNGHHDTSYPVLFNVTPQQRSLAAAVLARRTGIETVPTLTCRDCREAEIGKVQGLFSKGLESLLVLYGDPFSDPLRDRYEFTKTEHLIRKVLETGDGVAPSIGAVTNQYAQDAESEVSRTISKVDAGADFVITNISFDSERVLDHRDALLSAGLDVPLLIQVSIAHSLKNIIYVSQKFGIPLPSGVMRRLSTDGLQVGVELAGDTFERLEDEADGVHFSYLFRRKSPIPAYLRLLDRIGRRPGLLVAPVLVAPSSAYA